VIDAASAIGRLARPASRARVVLDRFGDRTFDRQNCVTACFGAEPGRTRRREPL
jgi:hypothetical protein